MGSQWKGVRMVEEEPPPRSCPSPEPAPRSVKHPPPPLNPLLMFMRPSHLCMPAPVDPSSSLSSPAPAPCHPSVCTPPPFRPSPLLPPCPTCNVDFFQGGVTCQLPQHAAIPATHHQRTLGRGLGQQEGAGTGGGQQQVVREHSWTHVRPLGMSRACCRCKLCGQSPRWQGGSGRFRHVGGTAHTTQAGNWQRARDGLQQLLWGRGSS